MGQPTPEKKNRNLAIIKLRQDGVLVKDIAKSYGISERRVWGILFNAKKKGIAA